MSDKVKCPSCSGSGYHGSDGCILCQRSGRVTEGERDTYYTERDKEGFLPGLRYLYYLVFVGALLLLPVWWVTVQTFTLGWYVGLSVTALIVGLICLIIVDDEGSDADANYTAAGFFLVLVYLLVLYCVSNGYVPIDIAVNRE